MESFDRTDKAFYELRINALNHKTVNILLPKDSINSHMVSECEFIIKAFDADRTHGLIKYNDLAVLLLELIKENCTSLTYTGHILSDIIKEAGKEIFASLPMISLNAILNDLDVCISSVKEFLSLTSIIYVK